MSRPGSLRVAAVGVMSNAFLNYDDDVYVTNKPRVLGGLTGTNRNLNRLTEARH